MEPAAAAGSANVKAEEIKIVTTQEVNVKAVVRLRPLPADITGLTGSATCCCRVLDGRSLVIMEPTIATEAKLHNTSNLTWGEETLAALNADDRLSAHRGKAPLRRLTFNGGVFGEMVDTSTIYVETIQPFVIQLSEGVSSVIVLQGDINSGKSFCCVGTLDHPGLSFLALQDLFSHIASYKDPDSANSKPQTETPSLLPWHGAAGATWRKKDYEFSVRCSFVEIRQEKVVDLLFCCRKGLSVTDTFPTLVLQWVRSSKTFAVSGVSEVDLTSIAETLPLLAKHYVIVYRFRNAMKSRVDLGPPYTLFYPAAALKKARDLLLATPSCSILSFTVEKAATMQGTPTAALETAAGAAGDSATGQGQKAERSSRDAERACKRDTSARTGKTQTETKTDQQSRNAAASAVEITEAKLLFVILEGFDATAIPSLNEVLHRSLKKSGRGIEDLHEEETATATRKGDETVARLLDREFVADANLCIIATAAAPARNFALSLAVLEKTALYSGISKEIKPKTIAPEESRLLSIHRVLLDRYQLRRQLLLVLQETAEKRRLVSASRLEKPQEQWWRLSPNEIRSKIAALELELEATRRMLLYASDASWRLLEGSRTSSVLYVLSSLRHRRFLLEVLKEERPQPADRVSFRKTNASSLPSGSPSRSSKSQESRKSCPSPPVETEGSLVSSPLTSSPTSPVNSPSDLFKQSCSPQSLLGAPTEDRDSTTVRAPPPAGFISSGSTQGPVQQQRLQERSGPHPSAPELKSRHVTPKLPPQRTAPPDGLRHSAGAASFPAASGRPAQRSSQPQHHPVVHVVNISQQQRQLLQQREDYGMYSRVSYESLPMQGAALAHPTDVQRPRVSSWFPPFLKSCNGAVASPASFVYPSTSPGLRPSVFDAGSVPYGATAGRGPFPPTNVAAAHTTSPASRGTVLSSYPRPRFAASSAPAVVIRAPRLPSATRPSADTTRPQEIEAISAPAARPPEAGAPAALRRTVLSSYPGPRIAASSAPAVVIRAPRLPSATRPSADTTRPREIEAISAPAARPPEAGAPAAPRGTVISPYSRPHFAASSAPAVVINTPRFSSATHPSADTTRSHATEASSAPAARPPEAEAPAASRETVIPSYSGPRFSSSSAPAVVTHTPRCSSAVHPSADTTRPQAAAAASSASAARPPEAAARAATPTHAAAAAGKLPVAGEQKALHQPVAGASDVHSSALISSAVGTLPATPVRGTATPSDRSMVIWPAAHAVAAPADPLAGTAPALAATSAAAATYVAPGVPFASPVAIAGPAISSSACNATMGSSFAVSPAMTFTAAADYYATLGDTPSTLYTEPPPAMAPATPCMLPAASLQLATSAGVSAPAGLSASLPTTSAFYCVEAAPTSGVCTETPLQYYHDAQTLCCAPLTAATATAPTTLAPAVTPSPIAATATCAGLAVPQFNAGMLHADACGASPTWPHCMIPHASTTTADAYFIHPGEATPSPFATIEKSSSCPSSDTGTSSVSTSAATRTPSPVAVHAAGAHPVAPAVVSSNPAGDYIATPTAALPPLTSDVGTTAPALTTAIHVVSAATVTHQTAVPATESSAVAFTSAPIVPPATAGHGEGQNSTTLPTSASADGGDATAFFLPDDDDDDDRRHAGATAHAAAPAAGGSAPAPLPALWHPASSAPTSAASVEVQHLPQTIATTAVPLSPAPPLFFGMLSICSSNGQENSPVHERASTTLQSNDVTLNRSLSADGATAAVGQPVASLRVLAQDTSPVTAATSFCNVGSSSLFRDVYVAPRDRLEQGIHLHSAEEEKTCDPTFEGSKAAQKTAGGTNEVQQIAYVCDEDKGRVCGWVSATSNAQTKACKEHKSAFLWTGLLHQSDLRLFTCSGSANSSSGRSCEGITSGDISDSSIKYPTTVDPHSHVDQLVHQMDDVFLSHKTVSRAMRWLADALHNPEENRPPARDPSLRPRRAESAAQQLRKADHSFRSSEVCAENENIITPVAQQRSAGDAELGGMGDVHCCCDSDTEAPTARGSTMFMTTQQHGSLLTEREMTTLSPGTGTTAREAPMPPTSLSAAADALLSDFLGTTTSSPCPTATQEEGDEPAGSEFARDIHASPTAAKWPDSHAVGLQTEESRDSAGRYRGQASSREHVRMQQQEQQRPDRGAGALPAHPTTGPTVEQESSALAAERHAEKRITTPISPSHRDLSPASDRSGEALLRHAAELRDEILDLLHPSTPLSGESQRLMSDRSAGSSRRLLLRHVAAVTSHGSPPPSSVSSRTIGGCSYSRRTRIESSASGHFPHITPPLRGEREVGTVTEFSGEAVQNHTGTSACGGWPTPGPASVVSRAQRTACSSKCLRLRLSPEPEEVTFREENEIEMTGAHGSAANINSSSSSPTGRRAYVGTPTEIRFSLSAAGEAEEGQGLEEDAAAPARRPSAPAEGVATSNYIRPSMTHMSTQRLSSSGDLFAAVDGGGRLTGIRRRRGGESWELHYAKKCGEDFCLPERRPWDTPAWAQSKQQLYFRQTLRPWNQDSTPAITLRDRYAPNNRPMHSGGRRMPIVCQDSRKSRECQRGTGPSSSCNVTQQNSCCHSRHCFSSDRSGRAQLINPSDTHLDSETGNQNTRDGCCGAYKADPADCPPATTSACSGAGASNDSSVLERMKDPPAWSRSPVDTSARRIDTPSISRSPSETSEETSVNSNSSRRVPSLRASHVERLRAIYRLPSGERTSSNSSEKRQCHQGSVCTPSAGSRGSSLAARRGSEDPDRFGGPDQQEFQYSQELRRNVSRHSGLREAGGRPMKTIVATAAAGSTKGRGATAVHRKQRPSTGACDDVYRDNAGLVISSYGGVQSSPSETLMYTSALDGNCVLQQQQQQESETCMVSEAAVPSDDVCCYPTVSLGSPGAYSSYVCVPQPASPVQYTAPSLTLSFQPAVYSSPSDVPTSSSTALEQPTSSGLHAGSNPPLTTYTPAPSEEKGISVEEVHKEGEANTDPGTPTFGRSKNSVGIGLSNPDAPVEVAEQQAAYVAAQPRSQDLPRVSGRFLGSSPVSNIRVEEEATGGSSGVLSLEANPCRVSVAAPPGSNDYLRSSYCPTREMEGASGFAGCSTGSSSFSSSYSYTDLTSNCTGAGCPDTGYKVICTIRRDSNGVPLDLSPVSPLQEHSRTIYPLTHVSEHSLIGDASDATTSLLHPGSEDMHAAMSPHDGASAWATPPILAPPHTVSSKWTPSCYPPAAYWKMPGSPQLFGTSSGSDGHTPISFVGQSGSRPSGNPAARSVILTHKQHPVSTLIADEGGKTFSSCGLRPLTRVDREHSPPPSKRTVEVEKDVSPGSARNPLFLGPLTSPERAMDFSSLYAASEGISTTDAVNICNANSSVRTAEARNKTAAQAQQAGEKAEGTLQAGERGHDVTRQEKRLKEPSLWEGMIGFFGEKMRKFWEDRKKPETTLRLRTRAASEKSPSCPPVVQPIPVRIARFERRARRRSTSAKDESSPDGRELPQGILQRHKGKRGEKTGAAALAADSSGVSSGAPAKQEGTPAQIRLQRLTSHVSAPALQVSTPLPSSPLPLTVADSPVLMETATPQQAPVTTVVAPGVSVQTYPSRAYDVPVADVHAPAGSVLLRGNDGGPHVAPGAPGTVAVAATPDSGLLALSPTSSCAYGEAPAVLTPNVCVSPLPAVGTPATSLQSCSLNAPLLTGGVAAGVPAAVSVPDGFLNSASATIAPVPAAPLPGSPQLGPAFSPFTPSVGTSSPAASASGNFFAAACPPAVSTVAAAGQLTPICAGQVESPVGFCITSSPSPVGVLAQGNLLTDTCAQGAHFEVLEAPDQVAVSAPEGVVGTTDNCSGRTQGSSMSPRPSSPTGFHLGPAGPAEASSSAVEPTPAATVGHAPVASSTVFSSAAMGVMPPTGALQATAGDFNSTVPQPQYVAPGADMGGVPVTSTAPIVAEDSKSTAFTSYTEAQGTPRCSPELSADSEWPLKQQQQQQHMVLPQGSAMGISGKVATPALGYSPGISTTAADARGTTAAASGESSPHLSSQPVPAYFSSGLQTTGACLYAKGNSMPFVLRSEVPAASLGYSYAPSCVATAHCVPPQAPVYALDKDRPPGARPEAGSAALACICGACSAQPCKDAIYACLQEELYQRRFATSPLTKKPLPCAQAPEL